MNHTILVGPDIPKDAYMPTGIPTGAHGRPWARPWACLWACSLAGVHGVRGGAHARRPWMFMDVQGWMSTDAHGRLWTPACGRPWTSVHGCNNGYPTGRRSSYIDTSSYLVHSSPYEWHEMTQQTSILHNYPCASDSSWALLGRERSMWPDVQGYGHRRASMEIKKTSGSITR